jgi:hypothetical protein
MSRTLRKRKLVSRFEQNGSRHFKVCPLCGSLNGKTNEECFACSWHGDFDETEPVVSRAIAELVARCPEVEPWMREDPVPWRLRWQSIKGAVRRMLRRGIDLQA